MLLAGLIGCMSSPDVGVTADWDRTVLTWDLRVTARVDDGMRVRVTAPGDADGEPIDAPIVVFVQGGDVAVERYDWLAFRLAARGYGVIEPYHPANLAIDAVGNARIALDEVPERIPTLDTSMPVAIGGHSLGGVVGAMNWSADERFGPIFLLASYPAEGTDVSRGGPVLSIVGSDDGSADPADCEAGLQRFEEPSRFAVVDGMNHYAFTDDASEADLAKDGVASRPPEETRPDALAVLDAWLDAYVLDDPDALDRLSQPFDGVVVE